MRFPRIVKGKVRCDQLCSERGAAHDLPGRAVAGPEETGSGGTVIAPLGHSHRNDTVDPFSLAIMTAGDS